MNDAQIEILRKLNDDYISSVAGRDARRFEALLAEDFLNTNPDGSLVTRTEFLAQIKGPASVSDFACDDVRIRLMGEIAVIHGRTTYLKADGSRGAGRYTDIWALRNGAWLCVAAHVTRG